MLAFACAMFVGVSCTPDNGDGTGNGPAGPEKAFKITFIESTLTPQYAAYTVEPKDETMLYVLPSNQDLEQYAQMMPENDGTNEGKIKAYIEMLANFGMIYPGMEEVDQNYVLQGPQVEYPREANRYDASQNVTLYAAGFSVTFDESYMPVVTLLTEVEVTEVPFKAYPTVTIAEEALNQTVASAEGTLSIDCVLENAVEGTEWGLESSAEWLGASWADNKLTLTYQANTAPVARKATVSVSYGNYTWFDLNVTQEKDATAEDVTFTFTVTETRFDGFTVDIVPSKKDVRYVLRYNQYNAEVDYAALADQSVGSSSFTCYTGDVTGHKVKLNPGNYWAHGYDYVVYAYAVATKEEEMVDYNGNPYVKETITGVLSSVSKTDKLTVDENKIPTLDWVTEGTNLVWNQNADRYDLAVTPGETVVLHFTVTNPASGAFVKINGNSLYDPRNVVDGEPVVDNEAGTITFKIDQYDTTKTSHYVEPAFVYTNADGDTWGISTPSLRLTQTEPVSAEPLSE